MDFLKAEIARKKKQMEESQVMAPDKKYFKRGDLAAKQEEEYWKRHKRLKSDHGETTSEDTQREGSEPDEAKPQSTLPHSEVIKRLRDRGEPIKLFGETEQEALQRLKKVEMSAPEINKGFKNDLKLAMDQVDQDYLQEILKSGGDGAEQDLKNDVKVVEDGTTYEDILKLSEGLGKGDESLDSEVVLKFMKLLLKMWATELNERPPEEKRGFKGKLASAQHSQTVTYMKPLLRKLKKRQLSSDILSCLVDIVQAMLDRNYLKANDAYLEMAIGNAPWPIGVTMVGIHARTGREKIFARNVAHVLNDETQRKYIQGVKRLMTCCQRYFTTDPSRCVNYEGEIH